MNVKPLSYWRVREAPAWPAIRGQGAMPTGPTATIEGADGDPVTLRLSWGQLVRASSTCDPERQVANLDAEPVGLVRTNVVEELAEAGVLEPVETDDDEPTPDAE